MWPFCWEEFEFRRFVIVVDGNMKGFASGWNNNWSTIIIIIVAVHHNVLVLLLFIDVPWVRCWYNITCGQGGRSLGYLLLGCGLWNGRYCRCVWEEMTDVSARNVTWDVISHKRRKTSTAYRISYRLYLASLTSMYIGSSHIMLCAVVVLTKYRLDGVLISKIDPFMYIIS